MESYESATVPGIERGRGPRVGARAHSPGGAHWLRMVRQGGPVPAVADRAGGGGVAMRRGFADARGRGGHDGGAAAVEEAAPHVRRLSEDARGEGPRHR